jgi:hypothetical protein
VTLTQSGEPVSAIGVTAADASVRPAMSLTATAAPPASSRARAFFAFLAHVSESPANRQR